MLSKHIIILAAGILAGCAVAQDVYTPTGAKGHTIACPFGGWSECYAKASELCGSAGYDVFDKTDDRNYSSSWGVYGGGGSQTNLRTMVIACKNQQKPT
jgi:hypothetical protein